MTPTEGQFWKPMQQDHQRLAGAASLGMASFEHMHIQPRVDAHMAGPDAIRQWQHHQFIRIHSLALCSG
jgi:hypothetical protein